MKEDLASEEKNQDRMKTTGVRYRLPEREVFQYRELVAALSNMSGSKIRGTHALSAILIMNMCCRSASIET